MKPLPGHAGLPLVPNQTKLWMEKYQNHLAIDGKL